MPVQATDIDQEIAYILQYWIQNNVQAITGTIGQNVVWNLAQFIKQNPENYQKAKVVSSNGNYTASLNECVIVFNNNSSGRLDWVDNRWNKYYFVNATDNVRLFSNGKVYFDVNGAANISLAARTSLYIAKGEDDYWYEVLSATGISTPVLPPLIGVVDRGTADDPVSGTSTFQSDKLIGLGATNNSDITILIDGQVWQSFGLNKSIELDNFLGILDIDPFSIGNIFVAGSGISIDLNQ